MGRRWSVRYKKLVLDYAEGVGSDAKSYREFDVPRSTFYEWKKIYKEEGAPGLIPKKPIAKSHPRQLSSEVIEKILHLRSKYHFGPQRITWYMERYHDISVSCSTVYRTLGRHGMKRLPKNVGRRAIHTRRYAKQVPGHHIQMDVKFLTFLKEGKGIKRYQYTAIDDATRVRVLKIYPRHTQLNAINFVNFVVAKLPFRIKMIRTDNGHEFQSGFHWHLMDLGIEHAYIKKGSPHLNGKVERSHRTDKEEFYQLLAYKGDMDLNKKLAEWENFYNLNRPHSSHGGKTPYEVLREKLA